MPMMPEASDLPTFDVSNSRGLDHNLSCQAVFAMLACARLGAVHSVVFGGFAGHFGFKFDLAYLQMVNHRSRVNSLQKES